MSKSIYELARKAINYEIEIYKDRLGTAEYASTHLATSMINADWLPVLITRYDDEHEELERIIVPVPSLEMAWRFVFKRMSRQLDPDYVDMCYVCDEHAYYFDPKDIRTAYENVRFETDKERMKHLTDGKGDLL